MWDQSSYMLEWFLFSLSVPPLPSLHSSSPFLLSLRLHPFSFPLSFSLSILSSSPSLPPSLPSSPTQVYSGAQGRTMIFYQKKLEVNELALKQDCQMLHGDIPQRQREITLKVRFTHGLVDSTIWSSTKFFSFEEFNSLITKLILWLGLVSHCSESESYNCYNLCMLWLCTWFLSLTLTSLETVASWLLFIWTVTNFTCPKCIKLPTFLYDGLNIRDLFHFWGTDFTRVLWYRLLLLFWLCASSN